MYISYVLLLKLLEVHVELRAHCLHFSFVDQRKKIACLCVISSRVVSLGYPRVFYLYHSFSYLSIKKMTRDLVSYFIRLEIVILKADRTQC